MNLVPSPPFEFKIGLIENFYKKYKNFKIVEGGTKITKKIEQRIHFNLIKNYIDISNKYIEKLKIIIAIIFILFRNKPDKPNLRIKKWYLVTEFYRMYIQMIQFKQFLKSLPIQNFVLELTEKQKNKIRVAYDFFNFLIDQNNHKKENKDIYINHYKNVMACWGDKIGLELIDELFINIFL